MSTCLGLRQTWRRAEFPNGTLSSSRTGETRQCGFPVSSSFPAKTRSCAERVKGSSWSPPRRSRCSRCWPSVHGARGQGLWPDSDPARADRKTDRGNDLLIAAQTVALGYTIVTDNEAEFARIAGLRRENWLRRV